VMEKERIPAGQGRFRISSSKCMQLGHSVQCFMGWLWGLGWATATPLLNIHLCACTVVGKQYLGTLTSLLLGPIRYLPLLSFFAPLGITEAFSLTLELLGVWCMQMRDLARAYAPIAGADAKRCNHDEVTTFLNCGMYVFAAIS
jgi:hypothetical protein